jgi:hypothetical protein
MRRPLAAALLVALATACGGEVGTRGPPAVPSSVATTTAAPTAATTGISIELHAPQHAQWAPSTLAPSKPTLGVVVANRGDLPLDVTGLRVHLEAVREGVSFRCAREVGAPPNAREPRVLAPGASFVFERELDCALPLVGSYAVRVAVSFGGGAPHEVRAFTLRVFAPPHLEPRTLDAVPGVWGAIGASNVMLGESSGSGRIVVALVNGARRPIELPPMRLALRTYRVGSPIPCEDEPIALDVPQVLAPGESFHQPVLVSCLGLGVEGSYDVAARLQVGDGDVETELGRLRIEIATDPSRRVPQVPSR